MIIELLQANKTSQKENGRILFNLLANKLNGFYGGWGVFIDKQWAILEPLVFFAAKLINL